MTLQQFLKQARGAPPASWARRAHIEVSGFDTLYVRYTCRMFDNQVFDPVLDIASVTVAVDKRGQGLFSKFLDDLRVACPEAAIYVENVVNVRLAAMLRRRGFQDVSLVGVCLFLPCGAKDAATP